MIDLHIRIPDDLAEKIKSESEANFRSVNGEIVHGLTKYFLGLMCETGNPTLEKAMNDGFMLAATNCQWANYASGNSGTKEDAIKNHLRPEES
jgi:hypothetical protein